MAALPAITAGVSVISSISSLSAKNKAAAAERQQQEEQRTQANASALAQQQQLAAAQQLAQQQFGLSTLARLAAAQQAEAGYAAQQQMAELNAQQQRYAIEAGALQQEIGGVAAGSQIAKQRAAVQAQSQTQQQASDQRAIANAEAIAQNSQQLSQALSTEDKRQLAMQTSGRLRSGSSEAAQSRSMLDRLVTAFSVGMELDDASVRSALQNVNETELARITEQLGLNDLDLNEETVAANLKMMRLNAGASLAANESNIAIDTAGITAARDLNRINAQLDQTGAERAYDASLKGYTTQGELNSITNASVNRSINYAQRNTRGAGIFDYLNAGVNAYSAVSPFTSGLFGGAAQPQATKYSGFPNANSNAA